jgi:hypothetical protein
MKAKITPPQKGDLQNMTGTAKAPFKAGGDKKLWILSSIFILAVFVYIGIQHRKIDRLSDENQLKAIELSTLKDTVAVYRNKAGESTYKLISVEIEKQNLKKSLELAAFDIKDLKDRDIKWRKVTSALRMQLAATGSGETSITDTFRINSIDTVYFQKVSDWTNNYLSIFDTEIVNRKLNFNYQYKTGISIIQEQKRKETVVSVFLTDPNASITTGNSISVKQKKRFYEKPYIWSAVAFFAGVFISR